MPGEKIKKLKDAGLAKQNTPKKYEDVIEGMTDAEINLVLDLKKRFDDAESKPPDAGKYSAFLVPPF
jgi:hypothetical protein